MPDAEGVELANWNSGIFDIITSSAFANAKRRDGSVRWPSLGPSPSSHRFAPFCICYQHFYDKTSHQLDDLRMYSLYMIYKVKRAHVLLDLCNLRERPHTIPLRVRFPSITWTLNADLPVEYNHPLSRPTTRRPSWSSAEQADVRIPVTTPQPQSQGDQALPDSGHLRSHLCLARPDLVWQPEHTRPVISFCLSICRRRSTGLHPS